MKSAFTMSKLSTLVVGLYVFILYSHLCVSGYSVVGWKRCTTSATAGHLMQSAHPQSYKPSPALSRLLLQPQRCSGYLCTDKTARSARRDLSTRSSSSVLFFTKGDEGKNIPTTTVNVNVSLQQKLFQFNKSDSEVKKYITPLLVIGAVVGLTSALGQHVPINQLLEDTVNQIAGLGPYGYLYFSLVYIVAELLAIPAMPLTASSGYLFGLLPGTLVVLFSATIAAGISFFIGRTFLRSFAQEFIQKSDKWRAVDKAIAKEGFKVILLLRLSPLLPFALSNYLYAVTSVDFASFITATFLGFAPGSFGIVYFGSAGKDILSSTGPNLPWYVYAGIGGLVLYIAQYIGNLATTTLNNLEADEKLGNPSNSNSNNNNKNQTKLL